MLKVKTPNGLEFEFPDNNSVEQIRQVLTSLGVDNLANARATQTGNEVRFAAPTGGAKGIAA